MAIVGIWRWYSPSNPQNKQINGASSADNPYSQFPNNTNGAPSADNPYSQFPNNTNGAQYRGCLNRVSLSK